MRRSFRERLVVSLSDGIFDFLVKVLEEMALPFSLLSRWARGKLPLWMAWDILRSTWAPSRIARRWYDRYRMFSMSESEQDEYLAYLARRRQAQHEADISRRT